MNRAFSLVELSIVLVILGLLTGGVLTGQSLIRAAELRSITTDFQRYISAVQAFRDKYFAMPGDMANATSFWGKDNTYCAAHTGTAATPGTCNGDGDGMMDIASGATVTGEFFRFWQQLALAGLVEGNFTGISGSGGAAHSIPSTNVPKSKISNGGWSVYYVASGYAGNAEWFAGTYLNTLVFGATTTTDITYNMIIKPEEAWNIDTKMDDGKPASGKVMSLWNVCTDAASQATLTANYALTVTTQSCRLAFPQAF